VLFVSLLTGTVGAAIVQILSWVSQRWRRRRSLAGLLLLEVHGIYLSLTRMAASDAVDQYVTIGRWPINIFTGATPYLADLFPSKSANAVWFYYDRIESVQTTKLHIMALNEQGKPLSSTNRTALLGYVRQALAAYDGVTQELSRFAPRGGVALMKEMDRLAGAGGDSRKS